MTETKETLSAPIRKAIELTMKEMTDMFAIERAAHARKVRELERENDELRVRLLELTHNRDQ